MSKQRTAVATLTAVAVPWPRTAWERQDASGARKTNLRAPVLDFMRRGMMYGSYSLRQFDLPRLGQGLLLRIGKAGPMAALGKIRGRSDGHRPRDPRQAARRNRASDCQAALDDPTGRSALGQRFYRSARVSWANRTLHPVGPVNTPEDSPCPGISNRKKGPPRVLAPIFKEHRLGAISCRISAPPRTPRKGLYPSVCG